MSEDPLGFKAGINFYAYCSNNPINCNDLTGLADIFKADISFGAQFRFDGKIGPVNVNALLDFGSFGQSTEGLPVATVRQQFNLGVTVFDKFGLEGGVIREAPQTVLIGSGSNPFNALDRVSFKPEFVLGFETNKTTTSQSISNFENDTTLGVGAKFGIGLDLSVNLSEVGRRFDGLLSNTFNSAPAASGGFVLYPNKPNTNTLQQVYSK